MALVADECLGDSSARGERKPLPSRFAHAQHGIDTAHRFATVVDDLFGLVDDFMQIGIRCAHERLACQCCSAMWGKVIVNGRSWRHCSPRALIRREQNVGSLSRQRLGRACHRWMTMHETAANYQSDIPQT